ncbi:MAG: hypothetical protein HY896_10020 [Deltaproteobacteria bacterium]|nr:hypothetical protein [Deltaproteobacteria bacterium]
MASEFRASLAAFVQPSHPVVQHILLDSADRLGADASSYLFDPFRRAGWVGGTEGVNKALYDCLAREYRIRYAFEPPSYERDCQVIRPPHVIIPSVEKKAGVGTCIDLCLLFASCLESVRLQPLLIVVREGESFLHCLLGCWTDLSERFEPVVTDPGRLIDAIRKAKLLLLEATGVTGRAGKVLSFNESAGLACELLHEDRFLFAVDVAAARQTVAPLQFPFQPGAVEVIRRAEVIAREEGYATLETRHLFGSFLLYEGAEDPFMEQIFSYLAADRTFLLGIYRKISRAGIRTKGAIPRPTLNYRRVLEDARFVAGDEGRKFVEKKHLFYALLLSPSAFVDRFFREAGTSRGQARQMFQGKYSWTKKIPETLFEWTGDGEG